MNERRAGRYSCSAFTDPLLNRPKPGPTSISGMRVCFPRRRLIQKPYQNPLRKGRLMSEWSRTFDVPRFDKGRWYVIRPDGSEQDIDPLLANTIADAWSDMRRAALIWYATQRNP